MTHNSTLTPLRRSTIIAYALLGMPSAICLPAFYLHVMPHFLGSPHSATAVTGTILAIMLLLELTLPLLFGYGLDRIALNFGRRRFGWLCGAAITLAGLSAFLLPTLALREEPLLLLASGISLTIGWALMRVSQLAWAAELTNLYHQRSRLYFAGQAAITLGVLVGLGMPNIAAQSGILSAHLDITIFSAALSTCIVASLMLLRLADPRSEQAPEAFLESFKRIRTSPSWRRTLIAHCLNVFANTLPIALILHISIDVIGSSAIILPVIGTYLTMALIGLPIGLALARRCGKHQSWSAALIFTAAVVIWIPLLSTGDGLVLLIITALLGFTAGMELTLPAAIQADTVDSEELRNDTARAGFQFGLWQCAGKFSAGLAVLLALGLLITAGGREAIMPGSAAGATELILVTVGLLPPFAKLMAVTQIWSLPLDAAKQKELQDRLQARRAATSQQKAPDQR